MILYSADRLIGHGQSLARTGWHRRKMTTTASRRVAYASSRLHFIYAALGYACIQIRQRGGSSNLSDKFSRGWRGRGLADSLALTLDFIKIHSARQAVTRAARRYRRTRKLIGLPCYYKRHRPLSLPPHSRDSIA